jgi:RNA recognition motif-containing protein
VGKKLFVGNLPYSIDEAALRDIFAEVGDVASASIITDRDTGRSRGFGFIEMADDAAAQAAIDALNGHAMDGRKLTVNEARPREPRRDMHGRRGR